MSHFSHKAAKISHHQKKGENLETKKENEFDNVIRGIDWPWIHKGTSCIYILGQKYD